jgi:hypothetical protein
MADDTVWVEPVVTGAEVDTAHTCDSCAALMVRLTIHGYNEDGAVQLPDILICPDHYDVQQVVADWRAEVRKHNA